MYEALSPCEYKKVPKQICNETESGLQIKIMHRKLAVITNENPKLDLIFSRLEETASNYNNSKIQLSLIDQKFKTFNKHDVIISAYRILTYIHIWHKHLKSAKA